MDSLFHWRYDNHLSSVSQSLLTRTGLSSFLCSAVDLPKLGPHKRYSDDSITVFRGG